MKKVWRFEWIWRAVWSPRYWTYTWSTELVLYASCTIYSTVLHHHKRTLFRRVLYYRPLIANGNKILSGENTNIIMVEESLQIMIVIVTSGIEEWPTRVILAHTWEEPSMSIYPFSLGRGKAFTKMEWREGDVSSLSTNLKLAGSSWWMYAAYVSVPPYCCGVLGSPPLG